MEVDQVHPSSDSRAPRLPYEAPALVVLGRVSDITQKKDGVIADGNPGKGSTS
jgi:hypothetical protein